MIKFVNSIKLVFDENDKYIGTMEEFDNMEVKPSPIKSLHLGIISGSIVDIIKIIAERSKKFDVYIYEDSTCECFRCAFKENINKDLIDTDRKLKNLKE